MMRQEGHFHQIIISRRTASSLVSEWHSLNLPHFRPDNGSEETIPRDSSQRKCKKAIDELQMRQEGD